jgi:hypothetical protein
MNENTGGADGAQGGISSASSDGNVQRDAVVTAPMSKEHAAGHAELAKIRAGMADRTAPEQRAQDWKRLSELHKHVFDKGAKPAWYLPEQQAPADMREWGGGLEAKLEAETKAIDQKQGERITSRLMVAGVPKEWADTTAAVAQNLELDEVSAKTFADRITKHALGGQMPDGNFQKLDDAERAELLDEASRLCGGVEKLEAMSRGAIEYLRRFPQVFASLERNGAFDSSLAFDPRLLSTLHFANERAKARAGK